MSETGPSKRPRKTVNYAAMDSLDISDDDEFSGFSSPVSRQRHHKPPKDSSNNEKSKLHKKRKLSKQHHVADSEAPPTSETEDSDNALARSAPRPRPALHEKLFQRDLEAALELSRQCAEVAAPEDNKENLPGSSFSPPRPLQSSPTAGITPVTVSVEVHGLKTPPANSSLVCRKGNTDVRILPKAVPRKGGATDQIVFEDCLPVSDVTGAEGDCSNRLKEHSDANSALFVHCSKNYVKSKACVIESDDDFNTATHPCGVTSTLVGETKIIIRSVPEKVSPLLLPKSIARENEDPSTSPKVREASIGVDQNNSINVMKGRQLATPPPKADLPTSGRRERARRAVSFLPEPDSESEDEWAEPDELDEDDLSGSEGSDFEPSPKKNNKKNAPANKKKVTSTKAVNNEKSSEESLKRSTATLANSTPSSVRSAAATPKAAVKTPLNRTPSSVTPISNIPNAAKPHSFAKNATTPATSFKTQHKSESFESHGDRGTSSSPVTAPVLSRIGSTSVPPQTGLARAAFKCPVINGATNGGSPVGRGHATSIPTGTLRLGLSRRASFKPLHPNATVK